MNNFKKQFRSVLRGKNSASSVITALLTAIFIVANTMLYVAYVTYWAGGTATAEEDLSITDSAKTLFDSAKASGKKITVTFCSSEADIKTDETYVYRTVQEFINKYPDFIEVKYANIYTLKYEGTGEMFDVEQYKKIERKNADGEAVLDADGNIMYDEFSIYTNSIIFECETFDHEGNVVRRNARVVTNVDFYTLDSEGYITSYNGEEIFTALASWVIADEHDTVYFTVGHGEVISTNLANLFVCAGYYIDVINLRKTNVPEDAAFVVISDPKNDFEKSSAGSTVISELDRLDDYKKNGGAFYVVFDPVARTLPNLEEFCADFGIEFKMDEEGDRLMIKDLDNAIGTDGFTLVTDYADTSVAGEIESKIQQYGGNIIIRDVAALDCDESKGAKPLLVASPAATLESGGDTYDDEGSYTVIAYSERKNDAGKDPARMIVVPSVYLTADDALITNGYANKDFIYSLFDVFYGAEHLPYGTKSVLIASSLLENLTLGTSITYTVILLAIPAIIALVGTVIIIRRKNR